MPYGYNYNYPNFNPPMPDQLTQLRYQSQPANNNGIIWVQGEEGAKAYMVAPGNTVLLMDSDGSAFYLKSADASGMPQPLRIFDYTERTAKAPAAPTPDYITRAEYDALLARVNALETVPAPTKKRVKEDADNA